jgi:hypothetical protein
MLNGSSTATVSVAVTCVNEVPTIANLAGDTLAYTQGDPATVIDQNNDAAAADVDSPNFDTGALTVSISTNVVATEDQLGIRNEGTGPGQINLDGFNVKYGAVTIGSFTGGGVGGIDLDIDFNASADAAAVSALLRNITYFNSNNTDPNTDDDRTVRFVLTDGDGGTSINYDATVTVAPNTPPVLTPSGAAPTFTENGTAVVLDAGLTVADANDTNLESATVTITNLQDAGAEFLVASTAGTSINPSYTAPTLTLTGTDTVANYQQVLRTVTYNNTSQNPNTTARSINFVANDGAANSNTVPKTVTVTAVNDAPSFTKGADQTVNEGAPAQTVNGWATAISDGDNPSVTQTLTFNITNNTNPSLFSAGPAISPTGTLTYTLAPDAFGEATLTITLSDNGSNTAPNVNTSAPQTFKITVNAVNDAPSFTAGGNQTVNEDAGAQSVTWATGISAGPNESSQVLSFLVSNNNNGLFSAQPAISAGGTLTYTPAPNANGSATVSVTLKDDGGTANGGVDSTGPVTFTITVNPVNDPPVVSAAPGPFSAIGNVRIQIPDGANDLLANASDLADGGGTTLTVNAASINSTNGGTVSVNQGTGQFSYNPPPGFTGADAFTYQVCDNGVGLPASACTAVTVTVNVSGMIWFVDVSDPVAGGDGRLTNPFNCLVGAGCFDAVAADEAGDAIFIAEGNYTCGLTLFNTEVVLGDGASSDPATILGLTVPPFSDALPPFSGTDPVLNNPGGSCLTLAQNNTIRGLTIGNTNATGSDVVGTNFGTLTMTETTLNGTGQALNLATGTLAVTLDGMSSTSGVNNVSLTNVAGASTLGGGVLSGATGTAFNVDGGTGTFSYSGTITQANVAQRPVSVANKTGGSVTFSGAITANTGPTLPLGIALTNNTGATITFQGGLTLNTGANAAFTATGGGTVNVCDENPCNPAATGALVNTLTTTTGTALNVANTTIGANKLEFRSISSNGGSNNGIILNTTGSTGGLTVTGDGANTAVGGNSSGGTIANKSGADLSFATLGTGIYLNNTSNVVLRRMTINGTNQNYGIRGTSVTNFTLEYSTVGGSNGTNFNSAPYNAGEGAIYFGDYAPTNGINGTGTFTNNNISGGNWNNVSIINTQNSPNVLTLTVKGNTFGLNLNNGQGNHSFVVENRGTGTINATVGGTVAGEPNTFTGARADHVNFTGQQGSTMDVVMRNNTLSNNHPGNIIGGGNLTLATAGTMTFHVTGNTMRDANGSAVTLFKASALSGTPTMSGFFNNNIIGVAGVADSGSKTGNGIFVSAGGTGTMSYTITNNQIHQIHGNAHIYADNTGGSYTANFTITGNTLDTPVLPFWFAGIAVTNGSPGSGDTVNVCAKIGGSTAGEKNTLNFPGSPAGLGIIVGSSGAAAGHTFNLPGFPGPTNLAQVRNFLQNNNAGTFQTDAYADAPATAAAFTGVGTSCPTPPS